MSVPIQASDQHFEFQSQGSLVPIDVNNNLAYFTPSAMESPLMLDDVYFLFNYFIKHFGSSMTLMHRVDVNPNVILYDGNDRRGRENFWTYDAPFMALTNPHVLNAILALASVQYANRSGDKKTDSKEFNGISYYQAAVKGLREDIMLGRFRDQMATLTTSLLLAFFETMYGDLVKWYFHMSGAKDIINALDMGTVAAGATQIYEHGMPTYLAPNEIYALQACDLLSSYLHMEIMQAVISKSQLLIPLEFWEKVPCRRATNNPHLYAYDVLLRKTARLCSWTAKDDARKKKLYGGDTSLAQGGGRGGGPPSPMNLNPEDIDELVSSQQEWESIRADLISFEFAFEGFLTPIPPQGPPVISPFGPISTFQSSYNHFLVCFINMTWLIHIRNNPTVPAYGNQTLRYTAMEGVPYMLKTIRALPPAVPYNIGHIGSENFDAGAITRLVIDMCVPVFFAAIQVRDVHQQTWIMSWLESCAKFTGWSTCNKIMSGVKKAWSFQKAAVAEMQSPPASTEASPGTDSSPGITLGSSPHGSRSNQTARMSAEGSAHSNSQSPRPQDASIETETVDEKSRRVALALGLLQ